MQKAQMDMGRLPHVRGGVSRVSLYTHHPCTSSPRAWGCFPDGVQKHAAAVVFPTCVGVFLTIGEGSRKYIRLPHVRGGVSDINIAEGCPAKSSPRAWGGFIVQDAQLPARRVFPTCVGVFLSVRASEPLQRCLPHVRGGVSLFNREDVFHCMSSPRAWGCFQTKRRLKNG